MMSEQMDVMQSLFFWHASPRPLAGADEQPIDQQRSERNSTIRMGRMVD
jgi:hypothetical protein